MILGKQNAHPGTGNPRWNLRFWGIVGSGTVFTVAGWVLFMIVCILCDDGGANEHNPSTFIELTFNALWIIVQWPYALAQLAPDIYYAWLFVPATVLSVAFWGCLVYIAQTKFGGIDRRDTVSD